MERAFAKKVPIETLGWTASLEPPRLIDAPSGFAALSARS